MVTLAKKIIAHASGKEQLATGDIVMASVDLAMVHDSSGPRRLVPKLQELGMSPWDSNKIVVVSDHFVPADTESAQMIQKITKSWVRDHDISHYYDNEGICHVLLPERGHIKPGMFCVGGDSHSPTAGAFGAYMFGVGATDMAGVMATGETWLTVPETILIEWQGVLQPNVCAKDMILKLCADFGIAGAADHVVQFTGSTISSLGMQERMTLTNMTAELGAQTGIIAPDELTYNYLASVGLDIPLPEQHWSIATCEQEKNHYRYNASALSPQVALPHSPANATDISSCENTEITVAYIGACTGAKLTDLKAAAQILRGQKVAQGVKLLVAPASRKEQAEAEQEGIMQIFRDAGATILPNACGICAGYGNNRLENHEVCISSTARNFKGRMGGPDAQVYLSSPLTVASSAIAGKIYDPRHFDKVVSHG
ncbi:MAG: 3-isopropylmalate dehydratase large subunit [Alphaproteobacteria bacterium]